MLYLLTPTGGRPEGITLLADYIAAQTWCGPARWIFVDDCDPATKVRSPRPEIELEVVRPDWRWQPGMNTQASCMAVGLARIPDDATCIVLEDDDAYLPGHFAAVLWALDRVELAGERVARYYNVATGRFRVIPGTFHASLASTACRGRALALLKRLCSQGSTRIDMALWGGFGGARALVESGNVVGIKGLPGRGGIGVGHRPDFGTPDDSGGVLIDWIGAERAKAYEGFRRT